MTRETRKIQKVGGSTFSVSLPKSWARARDLSAGSLVTVYAHPDDVLVVQPGEGEDVAERTVRVEHDDPDRLETTVRAAYAAGLDALRFEAAEGLTREQRRAVGGVTEALPGTAVVEEREDRMVVRVLLDGEEISIQQSVRQLAFVAAAMHREALGALVGETPPDAVDRDAEADRLFALVDRHFQRGLSRILTLDALGTSRPELADLRAAARELQQVAADARRLGDLVAERADGGSDGGAFADGDSDAADPPADAGDDSPPTQIDADLAGLPDDLPAIAERACEIVETATDAVVTDAGVDAPRSAIAAHADLRDDLETAERELLATDGDGARGADGSGRIWQGRAIEHCRRTAEHGAAIARLALRGSLRRGEADDPVLASGDAPSNGTLADGISAADEPGDPLDAIEGADGSGAGDGGVDGAGGADAEAPDAAPDADG